MPEFSVGSRKIGENQPTFIIAELSGNHNQSYEKAEQIVRAACEAGVDAIKLQTYTADTITIDCDKPWFQVKLDNKWGGQTLHQLYRKAFTPWEWHVPLKKIADNYGVVFFSTPFDETAVDFLETLNVPLYKVASFEVVDTGLLKKIAKTGKPVIMSRGMASVSDLELACKTLKDNGCKDIAILHCVSDYPAKPEEMNLATIQDIRQRFGVVAGLSDHSLGSEVAVAAVALGARIIEKHITSSREYEIVDADFSLTPPEFKELVRQIRNAERAIGHVNYGPAGKGEEAQMQFRRSLFVVKDIKQGQEFTKENIRSIRPGWGLPPKDLDYILGKKAKTAIERGTPLSRDLIE